MANVTCANPSCSALAAGRGKYCLSHSPSPKGLPLADRMMARVDRRGDDECWPWCGYLTHGGYGVYRSATRNVSAHRFVYEYLVGPVPIDKVLDHVCHNTSCVNPNHLRPVTPKQNVENFSAMRVNNTSGYRGVYRHSSGLWAAEVTHRSQRHHAGYYKTPQEAGAAAHAMRLALHSHNDLDRAS